MTFKDVELDVAEEIIEAERKITDFFAKQGIEGWQYKGLADRNLVAKLEQACMEYKLQAEAFHQLALDQKKIIDGSYHG